MGKMDNIERLGGQQFGEWYVHDVACGYENNGNNPNIKWLCECSCGALAWVRAADLKRGKSTRCKECGGVGVTSHGGFGTRLYKTWRNIKQRCYNENNCHYADYGKRGIKVCDQWLNDYESFRDWALETGYDDSLTLDRINVNGNYEPNNCRWATMKEQARNRRDNRSVMYKGRKYGTVAELAEELGLDRSTLYMRIFKYKWPEERWAEPARVKVSRQ